LARPLTHYDVKWHMDAFPKKVRYLLDAMIK
jgi:hypothetical protein